MRTMFIRVWFGPLPPWVDLWRKNTETLKPYGFDFMLVTDYELVRDRFRRVGVEIAPYGQIAGTRKAGDFDPCYGEIFAEELSGYDFWGHTGLDCVYGRLDRFVSDEYLSNCDVFGNDPVAICGPFSLYRNAAKVNSLFRRVDDWQRILSAPAMNVRDGRIEGFDEGPFSDEVVRAGVHGEIRFKTAFWQSHDKHRGHVPKPQIRIEDDGTLRDLATGKETMMFHFNRRVSDAPFGGRQWPVSC